MGLLRHKDRRRLESVMVICTTDDDLQLQRLGGPWSVITNTRAQTHIRTFPNDQRHYSTGPRVMVVGFLTVIGQG